MPKITVEFYKPSVHSDEDDSFADLMTTISETEPVQRIRRGADPAAIFALVHTGSEFTGEAAKIRMEDLPRVVDTATGDRHDIHVREREGLSEEICFLYDSDIDVIAVQRNVQ